MPLPHIFATLTSPANANKLDANFDALESATGSVLPSTVTAAQVETILAASGYIRFVSGVTYNLADDIAIPANSKIVVEKGATVINTGGRFTAYDVDNVEWHIDGWVKSVSMVAASYQTGWSTSSPYVERGFIEFGSSTAAARSGFLVHGTGKVSADWTGTPNVSDFANQMNTKGIAAWNPANVLVEGLDIFGFNGEAVYAFFFDASSKNIVFHNNNVHDTRFNALNFNAATNGGGCKIHNNRVKNAYAIELSVGECTDNYVDSCIGFGIWTGVGAGYGQVVISRNTVINTGPTAGAHGIAAVYASGSPVTGVDICDNIIVNSNDYSIYVDYIREFTIRGNKCIGSGQGAGAYDIGVNHSLRGSVSENTFLSPGAFAQSGRIGIGAGNYDVSICPDSNIYLATTGTAPPVVGNGVQTVASTATMTLPVLGSIFSISGANAITSIPATNQAGRTVTLVFSGSGAVLTDGGNLKLAGDLSATTDDTATLVCDGTNWHEVCRSVN